MGSHPLVPYSPFSPSLAWLVTYGGASFVFHVLELVFSIFMHHWIHANKVCRHTLLSALSNDLFDVYCSYKEAKEIWDSFILKYIVEDIVRQRFIIGNYYHWEMIEDKDIKIQIKEYHKLFEDIKQRT